MYTSVTCRMANRPLHVLALRNLLKKNKKFLSALKAAAKAKLQNLLNAASSSQLRLLQKLLVAFVRGAIPVTAKIHQTIKRSKYYSLLISQFNTVVGNAVSNLPPILCKLGSLIQLLLSRILKKER